MILRHDFTQNFVAIIGENFIIVIKEKDYLSFCRTNPEIAGSRSTTSAIVYQTNKSWIIELRQDNLRRRVAFVIYDDDFGIIRGCV